MRDAKFSPYNTVVLPLYGHHGRGRDVTLDRAVWERISERYGKLWRAVRSPHDHLIYPVSWTKQAVAAALEDGIDVGDENAPVVLLARVIARPKPGERVFTWCEGDRFDFRVGAIVAMTDERLAWLLRDTSEEQRKKFIAVA